MSIPTWSTVRFTDGGWDFTPRPGQVTGWRRQLTLRDGSITTTARWTAPNGHVSDLRYVVFTDRARIGVAVVRLELIPRWTGTVTITDLIDGTPATASTGVASGWDETAHQYWETVRTRGLGVLAGLSSRLGLSEGVRSPSFTRVGDIAEQTVGQRVTFPVTENHSYTVTNYVGVATSHDATSHDATSHDATGPDSAARQQSSAAARRSASMA